MLPTFPAGRRLLTVRSFRRSPAGSSRHSHRSTVPSRCRAFLGALMLSVATASASGCEGTSIGNPPGATQAQIQLGLQGQAGIVVLNGALPDAGVGGQGGGEEVHEVVLDEVWLAFGQAALVAAGQCGSSASPGIPDAVESFAAELVSGRVLPARPSWSRPSDESYCAVRLSIEGAASEVAGAPAGLTGATLFAKGKRADGVPLEARLVVPAQIALGPKSGAFTLGTGEVGMVLVFDFDDWFETLALASATVEGGRILLDADHNASLAQALAARIPPSARLFRDSDRDGQYEANEGKEELDR